MVNSFTLRHPFLYTTGSSFAVFDTGHLCCLAELFELFRGYIVFINDGYRLLTIEDMIFCIQEMKIRLPQLYMLILFNLKFPEGPHQLQAAYRKPCIFHRFFQCIDIDRYIPLKNYIECRVLNI